MAVAEEEIGGVHQDAAIALGGDGEAPEDGLGEGVLHGAAFGGVGAGGAEVLVALDHEDAGADALEGDDLAAAFLAAVEADVVGAESGGEAGGVEDGGVEARNLQPEVAGALFPIDGEEAVELLHAGGALLNGGDAGGRLCGGATSGLLGVEGGEETEGGIHRKKRGLVLLLGQILRLVLVLPHAIDALLHFAHAGQILVQLGFVVRADRPAEAFGVILHAIENAHVSKAAAVLKKVVEGQRGVDFIRHRRVRSLPGDVRAVGHREVRLVVSGHRLLASQNDAGLRGILADTIGDHLIHGDARFDDGALLNGRAGEQASGLRGVNALAGRPLVEQAVNHVDLMLQRLKRRQGLAELHIGSRTLGAPMILVHAIPHEQNRETFREGGWRGGIGESRKGLEPRQGHGDSGAAKNRTAGNAMGGFRRSIGHLIHLSVLGKPCWESRLRLFRNCGLVTMVSTNGVKR